MRMTHRHCDGRMQKDKTLRLRIRNDLTGVEIVEKRHVPDKITTQFRKGVRRRAAKSDEKRTERGIEATNEG